MDVRADLRLCCLVINEAGSSHGVAHMPVTCYVSNSSLWYGKLRMKNKFYIDKLLDLIIQNVFSKDLPKTTKNYINF